MRQQINKGKYFSELLYAEQKVLLLLAALGQQWRKGGWSAGLLVVLEAVVRGFPGLGVGIGGGLFQRALRGQSQAQL